MTSIFLSHATEDDDVPTVKQEQLGWISQFDRALTHELRTRLGIGPHIWRDRRDIDRTAALDNEIENGLRSAKALLSVVSPTYVQKTWCLKELSRFVELRAEACEDEKRSLFKIVKYPLGPLREPDALTDLIGYDFYAFDREKNTVIEFYHHGRGVDPRYWDEIARLADRLTVVLQQEQDTPRRAPVVIPARDAADSRTVFIARASSDLDQKMRSIRGELEAMGLKCLPHEESPQPMRLADVASLTQPLGQADIALHMIGKTAGFTPEGADKPITALQLDATYDAGIRRVIWMPALPDRDETAGTLVANLSEGRTMAPGDELIEGSITELKSYLVNLLGIEPSGPVPESRTIDEDEIERMSKSQMRALLKTITRKRAS